ncbi:MAG TPA: hypothetical protein DGG95_03325 [Cytophagales bacterium]|jgi:hypothetical protein|nr:hypothetical protein [Cytophagales bacterium]
MLAAEESYRGISFIRISSLPLEQKKKIKQTIDQQLIIKIKREDLILADCVQYNHYLSWYENIFKVQREPVAELEMPALNSLAIAS